MNKEQAHKIVTEVCNVYKGTFQEHQTIRMALAILTPAEEAKEVKKAKEVNE